MSIVILNVSPRPKGNTAAMVAAYRAGAESVGHHVDVTFELSLEEPWKR